MLDPELKTALDAFQGETKTLFSDLQNRYESLKTQNGKLQAQLDAIDAQTQGGLKTPGNEQKSLADLILQHPAYLERKENGFQGRAPLHLSFDTGAFQHKTNITDATVGFATSGVLMPVRLPGLTILPQQALRVRDLLNVIPQTVGSSFDFARQNTRSNATSPQVEASPTAESTYMWETGTDQIRTIAHYTNVSRQALSDIPWMRSAIDNELIYGLKLKEEAEILSGVGTGVHLNGIITQATPFAASTYNVGSWQRIDQLRKAKLQARLAGLGTYQPSAYVLHPSDMEAIELTKDSYGRYIVGDPQTGVEVKTIWNLPVVESDSMTPGTFLVGAFNTAVRLIDRQSVTVEISFEHASNFTSLLATILCEERVGLAVEVPTAFVYGSFSSSPA
jgi:HK97 family phage major capsid protein